ncbi:hypothetical protein [Prauserella muralis]|uniref:Uncharacterized protein n=1 Tax=Prauserella muralis TaxID=588067 RepID=A0A2V4AHR3_9PSEU|nr:hypothetical protein [Prauserella muralis]PXY19474.1 hypothetical protein BAY60_32560 [Prauserella muralis]TWE29451.1 hypothetical protein FHX69_2136 [Prauserella muralis]
MSTPDPDVAQEAIEYCYAHDWTDGLPVVPASAPLVERFLATTARAPQEVIGRSEQFDRAVTVEQAAINAAMAGCLPEYFPVVLAAWEALTRDRAARGGGWQSTSGPAPMIVVNGPVRQRLGINCGGGVFGPGYRPNATIARAIGLIVRNGFGIRPGVLEQATQGLPGRWSICLGENEEESPWQPLAADAGITGGSAVSAMLLRTCEFVDNRHTQDPEQILWDFADTISRTGSLIFRDTSAGVVFSPEHAQLLAKAGLSKADVQRWFTEHCGRTRAELYRAGKNGTGDNGVRHADAEADPGDTTFERFLPSPLHVPIVVAGSRNAAMSMVVRVFGVWSGEAVGVEDPVEERT